MRNRLERDHVPTDAAAAADLGADEVEAALERIVTSAEFRNSPQLAAFLRYVVEAVLRGERDRIKGYTIGVEALGRDERFDPQTDPIVRVEATRLRRTMERYYNGAGVDDPVIIVLRRGSYVPAFHRRDRGSGNAASRWAWLRLPGGRGGTVGLGLLLVGILGAIAVGFVVVPRFGRDAAHQRTDQLIDGPLRAGNGMPTLLVTAFDVTGTPDPDAVSAGGLLERVRDAFARFDAINIASRPANGAGARIGYQFAGSIEYHADHTATARFRLMDNSDQTVVWSKTYDRMAPTRDRAAVEDGLVVELAATLLQPFGVIRSHERVKQLASGTGDPRYLCVIEASESLRSLDPQQHARARACLERLTSIDSSFVSGLRYLAAIYLREYLFGTGDKTAEAAALDRALRTARTAVELQPESSRGYHTLASIYFARGEAVQGIAADEHAIALNKYDMAIRSDLGGHLIAIGEIDRGMAMLQSVGDGVVRQSAHRFSLFLGSYLRGDLAAATAHARQITSNIYPLGFLARALAAAANGDQAGARAAFDRLAALQPAWRTDMPGQLKKFFPAPAVADRLARDLAGIAGPR